MSKDSHVTAQNAQSFPVRKGEKFRFSKSWKKFNFSTLFSDFSSRGSLFMLLHLIFITFVVCTAEISEFHAFFLCFFAHFGNFSLVSFGAWDKFSLLSVVVSLSMSQTRGSCGHLKGSYDNHSSCLNCSDCFRSTCCSVCQLWPHSTLSLVSKRWPFSDRQKMGKTKEEKAKAKKGKDSTSRNSSSSRPRLEQTVWWADPSGSTADGHDDDNASVLSLSSSGGERVRGDTGVPSSRSSHGTLGLSPKGRRAHRSTPARSHSGDLAGKYGVQASAMDFEAMLLDPNPTLGNSDQVMLSKDDPLGLSQMPSGTILLLRHRSKLPVNYEGIGSADFGYPTGGLWTWTGLSWTGFRLNDRYPVPGPSTRYPGPGSPDHAW